MADFKENVENLNVRQIVMSSVMTAFGLVVALVWKDTIVATVDYLLPNTDDGTLQGMYISAIAVTILVISLFTTDFGPLFLASDGDSICSQTATLYPARVNLDKYISLA